MSVSWNLIILDRVTDDERDAVHEIVKVHAAEWWHELENVWIVQSQTPGFWKALIKPVIPNGSSGVMVLSLPPGEWGDFSAYGPDYDTRTRWLENVFKRKHPFQKSLPTGN